MGSRVKRRIPTAATAAGVSFGPAIRSRRCAGVDDSAWVEANPDSRQSLAVGEPGSHVGARYVTRSMGDTCTIAEVSPRIAKPQRPHFGDPDSAESPNSSSPTRLHAR